MTYLTATRGSARALSRTPRREHDSANGFPIFAVVLSLALLAIALAFGPSSQDVFLEPGALLQITGL
jgi:hypothetical protein